MIVGEKSDQATVGSTFADPCRRRTRHISVSGGFLSVLLSISMLYFSLCDHFMINCFGLYPNKRCRSQL